MTGIKVAIFHDTARTLPLLKLKLYFNFRVDKLFTFQVSQGTKLRSPNDDRAKMTVGI